MVARGEGGILDIVDDGRQGVLYAPAEAGEEAPALAAAIRQLDALQPEREKLRQRAELFSERLFRERMAAQIATTQIAATQSAPGQAGGGPRG